MKLHYSKILLFFLSLNILVTLLSNVHNKNKPYITPHHTQTNRSLCECDAQSSIYDNDVEIKSVKEIFDRQTSQRFEEYEECMKGKRQKRKEERDKNIQKIIEKDKMEKSLAEKVEKVCLRCGCGLGGVAAGVGIFGAVAVKELTKAAMAAALAAAQKAGVAAGKAAGIETGKNTVIGALQEHFYIYKLKGTTLQSFFISTSYNDVTTIASAIDTQMNASCGVTVPVGNKAFCGLRKELGLEAVTGGPKVDQKATITKMIERLVKKATETADFKAAEVATSETAIIQGAQKEAIEAASTHLYSAIGYSVLSILIIVLIMIIIYLVLRHRRKKKMKKKAQYTKLLNQ
nr:rifin PIR protein,putative [Plasmodium sp. DRC-Itaito]